MDTYESDYSTLKDTYSIGETVYAKATGLTTWLSGWDKRVKLTIDQNDIDSALSNFPVLIYLSTSSGRNNDDVSFVFDELQSDANRRKIAVTTSDGTTECYVEIEKWDDAGEQAWLWVKALSISSTADTDLYLYYDVDHADNTAYVGDTDSTPAENVWTNGFQGVWHLAETPTWDDWGKTTIGGTATTLDHSRAMGGTSPDVDDMKITSISMYLGAQTGNVRLAVYTGGQLNNPASATLLWDAGTVNPNGIAGWYNIEHPSGGVSWPKNTVTWLAWKRNTGVEVYADTSSLLAGDFQTTRGRNDNNFNRDPSVGFPSTYGDTGTFANYWYTIKVDYTTPLMDSTSNSRDATKAAAGHPATTMSGQMDGAQDFDGSDDYVQTTCNEMKTADDFTMEVWFKADTTSASHHILWQGPASQNGWGEPGDPNSHEMHLSIGRIDVANRLNFFYGYEYSVGDFAPAVDIDVAFSDTTSWHYATVVMTGAGTSPSATMYLDAVSQGSDTGTETGRTPWDTALRIGGPGANQRYFDGIADEVRISTTTRSLAWIKASYETGRDDLVNFGGEDSGLYHFRYYSDWEGTPVLEAEDLNVAQNPPGEWRSSYTLLGDDPTGTWGVRVYEAQDSTLICTCSFTVQVVPEFPYGAMAALVAGFAIYLTMRRSRKRGP